MSIKTRKYIYRIMMALGVLLTGVGIVKQEGRRRRYAAHHRSASHG